MKKTATIFILFGVLAIIAIPGLFMALFVGGRLISNATYGWEFTKNKPNPRDIVGVYLPNQKTRDFVRNEGRYATREMSITLLQDGTFKLVNVPDWWRSVGNKGQFSSMSGTWRIGQQENWFTVELNGKLSENSYFGTSVDLIGDKAPYKLSLSVGDPDQARAMEFEFSRKQ